MSDKSSFFAELKRRNVYKVAVAYVVVAWLLLQAASIFLPAFDAPPWVMKIFIIVIIFGLPVALIFSWAFEITPEGIKLESEIEPSKSIARRTGRKIVAVTIALAVVAAGLFVYQLVQTRSTITPPASAARTEAGHSPLTNRLPCCRSIISAAIPTTLTFVRVCRMNPHKAGQGRRPEGDLAHINATLQEHAGQSSPDREATWSGPYCGRERAEGQRPGAGECAAHQCAHRRASLG